MERSADEKDWNSISFVNSKAGVENKGSEV